MAGSLKCGQATASLVVGKWSAASRQNTLAAALKEWGTLRRTIHAAKYLSDPEWALGALGPVPDDPLDRLDWLDRAAKIAAYREMYGWDHDTEADGPEPAGDSPGKRAAWHAAFGAMNRTDGVDLRGLRDRERLQRRGRHGLPDQLWLPLGRRWPGLARSAPALTPSTTDGPHHCGAGRPSLRRGAAAWLGRVGCCPDQG